MAVADFGTKDDEPTAAQPKKPATGVGLGPADAPTIQPQLPPPPLATNDPMAFAPPVQGGAVAGLAGAAQGSNIGGISPGGTPGTAAPLTSGGALAGLAGQAMGGAAPFTPPTTAPAGGGMNVGAAPAGFTNAGGFQFKDAPGPAPIAPPTSTAESPLDAQIAARQAQTNAFAGQDTGAYNRNTAIQDATNNTGFDVAGQPGKGSTGVYGSEGDRQGAFDQYLAQAGQGPMIRPGTPASGAAPFVPPAGEPPGGLLAQAGATPVSGIQPPAGPSVGGSPATGLSLPPQVGPTGSAPASTPAGATAVNGGVGLSNINPDDSLLSKQITPNNSVDRVAVNNAGLQSTIDNVLRPSLNAASRDVAARSFGAGRGVSGQNRTAQGNLASDFGRQIADLTAQSNRDATTGTIDDLYKNIGIAQQQQGFQKGERDTAFGQDYATRQLEDQLTNSQFGRSSAQEQAGYANSPQDIQLILSRIFGDQATGAGNAAAGLFGQAGNKAGQGTSSSGMDFAAILKALGIGQGGGGGGADSAYPDD